MGTIALDNGEFVYIHDGTGDADPVAISGLEGSNLAALMANRERFDYTWANSTARTAQTGMLQGSRGYQIDTKTEYIYDNSAWRLFTGHVEYTGGSIAVGANQTTSLLNWSVDNTNSTDTSFVSVSTNGFTFLRAGIYGFRMKGVITNSATTAYLTATWDNVANDHIQINPFSGIAVGSLPIPNLRIPSPNTTIYVWVNNPNACTIDQRRIAITRLG